MVRRLSSRDAAVLRIGLMSWLLTSILVVLIVFDPKAATAANPLQLHGALKRSSEVGVIAHRGAAALAPENTLASMRLAIEQGADFIETDLQLTADGVPVLMHDPEIDRTTNGAGAVASHTLEQLRALDAGGWYGAEFAGEPVPTLEEFVALLRPAPTRAFVELKAEWPTASVIAAIELLRSEHLTNRVVLASFERTTLEDVRVFGPEFATVLLTRDLEPETIDYAIDLQASAVCARDSLIAENAHVVSALHDAGIGTIAYTLNEPAQWELAAGLGVDYFVTDDAAALTDWRDSRGQ